jgi:cyanophycinase
VALVGAGEFSPAMAEFDGHLLGLTGRARPRVAVLPTASAPDGEEVFRRWAAMGVTHFSALGAEVEPVLVRDAASAADPSHVQAIGEADLIYLSGGKPGYLRAILAGSPAGAAISAALARGTIVAGCSAGAMVLAARQWEPPAVAVPWPIRWRPALGFLDDIVVIPHYDAWPEPFSALIALQAPNGSAVLGIDERTAIVGRDGAWQVHGEARVTVWHGRHRERFRAGQVFRL